MPKFKPGDVITKDSERVIVGAVCYHADGKYDYQCLTKKKIIYIKPEEEEFWDKIGSYE